MTTALRNTGIEPVGEMPWGTHFCHFYETTEDLLDILLPFFKAGLESNEFCAWVVCEPLTEAEAWRALDRAVPRLDRYVADHSIEVLNGRDVYLAEGEIDLRRITGTWKDKLNAAVSRRYEGIRASGDIGWLGADQCADFMEYEAEVNRIVGDQRMLLLCTYPVATRAASNDVMRRHQFAVGTTADCVARAPRRSSRMSRFGATLKGTLTDIAASMRHAEYAGRCSRCRRGFLAGTPLRWCISGHKLHQACVKHSMEREVCPICGIYVSEFPAGRHRS
jgi:MEDS: MEthanogen/methylotroph, DcmR Sensory domain